MNYLRRLQTLSAILYQAVEQLHRGLLSHLHCDTLCVDLSLLIFFGNSKNCLDFCFKSFSEWSENSDTLLKYYGIRTVSFRKAKVLGIVFESVETKTGGYI